MNSFSAKIHTGKVERPSPWPPPPPKTDSGFRKDDFGLEDKKCSSIRNPQSAILKGGAVVLLSGGQDSTTCLYWAKAEGYNPILALTFDYGQRHRTELDAARNIAELAGTPHQLIKLGEDVFTKSNALTGGTEIVVPAVGLPSTFVPGRNLLFLTVAAGYAYGQDWLNLVGGMCQADASGYPDCRANTIEAIETAIMYGMNRLFRIHTPLMWLTKAESVKLAASLPGCWDALAFSQTCYYGFRPPCGECPACQIREKGFRDAGMIDPLSLIEVAR